MTGPEGKKCKCKIHQQVGIDICEDCWEDAKRIGAYDAKSDLKAKVLDELTATWMQYENEYKTGIIAKELWNELKKRISEAI